MALLNINPAAIGKTIAATAGGRLAQAVAQAASPKVVQDVQRVLKIGNLAGNVLGLRTGMSALDNLLGLTGGTEDTPSAALGGLTLNQARAVHAQLQAARIARKNLFFLRIEDANPPRGSYQPAAQGQGGGLAGLVQSRLGGALGTVTKGITNGVSSVLGGGAGAAAGGFARSLINGALGGGNSIAQIALNTFDMMAIDVSYGTSLVSEHTQVGGSFIDKPMGLNPTELSVQTMDDEAGTLKRWFEGKVAQVAHADGTFGLPWEYLVQIEVVHAIPSEQVQGWESAYRKVLRLRPESIQVDQSRREQAVMEMGLVFKQFDGFMGTI
jgi:hypothetical protein